MDLSGGGFVSRSGVGGPCREAIGLESLSLDEFRHLVTTTIPQENGGSFTALLELPPTQAVKLLHFTGSSSSPSPSLSSSQAAINTFGTLGFPSDSSLMDRAALFSAIATENQNGEEATTATKSSDAKVKTEPYETDSSQRLISDQSHNRSCKRKEFEKKAKSSTTKKKKDKSSEETEKLPYVHVRARRGQATDSHSLAERARREKINARMKLLQELVPGCDKIQGTALVLDEIINHVQSLQRQVEMLSMRLAAVNPRIDFNLDTILASENGSLMDGSCFNGVGAMQLAWPHQVIETEQSYHHRQLQPPPQQWPYDDMNQQPPVWGREEDLTHGNDHNSLMVVSENLVGDSSNLHPSHVKTEL
ncbi:unnamed protein product [Cochlearia groenlandica]